MKKLPIGKQDFEKLIVKDCVYVDKTAYIYRMMQSGGDTFFLSRPRRFGKSLLLSTIQAVFEGKKELFNGLYITDKIDWEPHPVLMLDMSKDTVSLQILKRGLANSLRTIADGYELELDYDPESPANMLADLIPRIYAKTQKRLVILVDEYDDREALQSFYVVLKASSEYLRFVFLTGVSKISQVSIFSGLNNLLDLTFDESYAGICGYTQEELETYFPDYIDQVSTKNGYTKEETLAEIKNWYNGYSWDGQTFVYNPYSVLLLFNYGYFQEHWFNTGSSTGLLSLMRKLDDFSPVFQEQIFVDRDFANKQALENLDVVPLFFQAGYLTIKAYHPQRRKFELQIPNKEVRAALSESVVVEFSGKPGTQVKRLGEQIYEGFRKGHTASAIENLEILFSGISYNAHEPNKNEGHYHALFQLTMQMAGIDHRAESYNHIGRADSVLIFKDRVYILEIKYAKTKKELPEAIVKAWKQIEANEYAKPYLNQGKIVHSLALAFSKGAMAYEEKLT